MLYYLALDNELMDQIGLTDVERMLTGVKLYITFERPPRKDQKKVNALPKEDINSEASRLRRFKNFGKTIKDQSSSITTMLMTWVKQSLSILRMVSPPPLLFIFFYKGNG